MLKKSRKFLLLAIAALAASAGSTVSAQDPSLGYAYLFGYGANNNAGIRSYVPAPPYFALHPPVYYGQRYTRPYGESPFASWPQLRSPASYAPQRATETVQSYYLPAAPAAPNAPIQQPGQHPAPVASPVVRAMTPVVPLIVENPYYHSSEASRLASTNDSN